MPFDLLSETLNQLPTMETLGIEPEHAWLAINLHLMAFITLWYIVLGGVSLVDKVVTNHHRER